MKKLLSLSEIDWISEGVKRPQPGIQPGNHPCVADCIPPVFPAYAKLFHPIYEDLSIEDHALTWQDVEKARLQIVPTPVDPFLRKILETLRVSTIEYGPAGPAARLSRILWSQLAHDVGLRYLPTLSSSSFTRQFPGGFWPRRLVGPDQGNLEAQTRDVLVSILQRHTKVSRCLFHVWILAAIKWEEDLLFQGALSEASLFPDKVENVRLTPTHWFPEDRSWLVCTDYDLTFTLIGGSESLVGDLLNSSAVECLRVDPETRVDGKADLTSQHR